MAASVVRRSVSAVAAVAGVAALAAVPALSATHPDLRLAVRILFWPLLFAALASSWNIVGGYAGQVSFGHSAFYGLGSYTVTLLLIQGVQFPVTLPLAGFFAALLAGLIGYPTFRLRGPFFAVATIGVGEIMRIMANNVEEVFRGGSSGLIVPVPTGWSLADSYYLVLAVSVAVLATSSWIRNSKFGLNLLAVRDDEEAAETLGIDVARTKLVALMLSAFFVGIGGAVEALRTTYIFPDSAFGLRLSVVMILMPLIGGVGTLWGPVIGAVIFTLVDQLFAVSLPNLQLVLFGGLMVGVLLLEPRGLTGVAKKLAERRPRVIAPAGGLGSHAPA